MAFEKVATVSLTHLSSATIGSNGELVFEKTAKHSATPRSYFDGPGRIDVNAVIAAVADKYDISINPSDYIFEAVRAVTAEVPNENGDAFTRGELLRFDHKLGTPIYGTFVGKPHHINHKTDNPKTARGVVIAAHYHDEAPPLDICPSCGTKTASVENRDEPGISCKKCGTVVKDEFVELLLAVDTKKDATFAEAVRRGSLNGLSMGCLCGFTDCSICGNRARNASQFCSHIKSGNKKKMFKTASGMKMAFEKCGEVTFTEISRVDQPADPTALQREILEVKNASLEVETKALIASTAVNKYRKMVVDAFKHKSAQAALDKDKELEQARSEAENAINEIKDTLPDAAEQLTKGLGTIKEYTEKVMSGSGKPASPEAVGMAPETNSAPSGVNQMNIKAYIDEQLSNKAKLHTGNMMIFAKAYKNLNASVTSAGNVTVSNPHGRLFVIKPESKPVGRVAANKLAREVLAHVAEHGLLETMTKYAAIASPKMAQVLEGAIHDFANERLNDNAPATQGGEDMNDMAEKRPAMPASTVASDETDMAGEVRGKGSKDSLAEEVSDMADSNRGPKKNLSDESHDDMGGRKAPPKTTHDDKENVDHGGGSVKKAKKDAGIAEDIEDELNKLNNRDTVSPPPPPPPTIPKNQVPDPANKPAKPAKPARPPRYPEPVVNELSNMYSDFLGRSKPKNTFIAKKNAQEVLPADDMPADDMPAAGMEMTADMEVMASMKSKCAEMREMCGKMKDADMKKCGEDMCKMAEELMAAMEKAGKSHEERSAKHTARVEQIYRTRFKQLKEASQARVASLEAAAQGKVTERLVRSMKLAAKRQQLNLEESPIKTAMFDVLTSSFDLDRDYSYPGMDPQTAAAVIERSAAASFDEFATGLLDRAAKFASMSEEAFAQLEEDVSNLAPTSPVVASLGTHTASTRAIRTAAAAGNMPLAPSPSPDSITSTGQDYNNRNSIRDALGSTRIASSSKTLKKA